MLCKSLVFNIVHVPGGVNYNGAGVGITQLEHPNGREVTAFNHQTGNYDTMNITMENAVDMDTNIRMGVMNFQDCLKRSNGNILIALQTYNYGFPMMDMALEEYAAKNGTTINEVKNNYNDIGWLNIVEYMHSNPHEYNRSWPEPRYGDPNYIENVLRYFVGDTTFYYHDGELKVFDLTTLEVEIVDDKSKISK